MTKTRSLQLILLVIALSLFVVSLFQPVWTCGKGGTPFDGVSVLAIGFMGLMFFNPAWFSNIVFVVAMISALRRTRLAGTWLPAVAAGLASTTLVGPYLCGVTGGPLGSGTGLDTGALAWIAAVWLASASVFLAPAALSKPPFPVAGPAIGAESASFKPDVSVQKIASTYAQDAVEMAREQFNISLDWSDSSIKNVEEALAMMHSSFVTTNPRPTEEQAMSFAKGYGSYIGEVYRRNHGGEWGIVDLNGQKFPGLQTKSGLNFWPWARALNRIMQGPENNVADYYRVLLEK